jgi:hypothetical protein
MKHIFKTILFILFSLSAFAQGENDFLGNTNYQQAFEKINKMLDGTDELSFENAIFETENAYFENSLSHEEYKSKLDFHTHRILQLAHANKDRLKNVEAPTNWVGISGISAEETEINNNKVLLNWAIYTYLTDTTWWTNDDRLSGVEAYVPQYPMVYDTNDPFGAEHWENTFVTTLLDPEKQKGNCFSMAALFYIFSQRLQSEAYVCTAPQHIFIQHKGFDGYYYNVELTTKTFPGSGTIKTYTYSSHEAVKNGISMRRLNEREAIALCFVQLAKGLEHKLSPLLWRGAGGEAFSLQCAETALKYDTLCLNALLLKAQTLEKLIKDEDQGYNENTE